MVGRSVTTRQNRDFGTGRSGGDCRCNRRCRLLRERGVRPVHQGQAGLLDLHRDQPDRIRTTTGPVGGAYVIPEDIEGHAPPNKADSCVGRYIWAHELKGADADVTTAETTIEGLTSRVVTITGIEAVTDGRPAAPKTGSYVTCPGRGETPPIETVSIDLDASPPTVSITNATGREVPPTFTVTSGQTENFVITARTNKADVHWHLVLDIEVDGKPMTVPILLRGHDFETTASSAAVPYRWQHNKWVKQASGGTVTAPPSVNPGTVTACQALDPPLVRALIGSGARPQASGAYTQTRGVKVPIAVSTCSITAPGPASSGAIPSVTLMVEAAATITDATTEYTAQIARYNSTGTALRPLNGIADSAASGAGVVLVRKGRFVINAQVNPASTSQQANLIALATHAAATVR